MPLTELRPADLRRLPAIREACQMCANTGIVIRDMEFRNCICPIGKLPGSDHWNGKRIHPEDFIP